MASPRTKTLAALAAASLALGACGSDEEPPAPEPAAEGEATAAAAPERPHVLELPEADARLVQVRRAAKVALRDAPGGEVLERVGDETEWGSPTVFLVHRTRGAWAAVPTPYFENGRLAWVRLDPRVLRAGSVDVAIEVDLSDFEARLLAEGEVLRSFAITIGMPEAPTPTGRFAVTDTFRGDLNPAYGCCAVALTARQTRLPSGWLGGDRIAIHGTTGPLGAEISHGCVRAADADVAALVRWAPPGTPVTIRQ